MVFKAFDTQQDKTVAVKVLSRHALSYDEEIKRRFQREASAGMQLEHPNIVKIFEAEEADGEFFISMEYIDGKTLRQLLRDNPLTPQKVIEIAITVCEALTEAHKMGIIHRDIKSENIMLTSQGVVKVMDFGLAKILDASVLTREGEMLGTPAYMSPQQAIGEAIDHRSDIFSLGVVLYELLTGKLPFTGDYEMAVLYAVLNEEPIGIRELNSEIPKALEQVILKALAKELQQRYQNTEEFIGDLTKIKTYLETEEWIPSTDLELVAAVEVGRMEERGFLARLVGRDSQFETLKSLLNLTNVGEGQTIFIGGEAGIGKTRLVWELERFAKTLKVRTLTGRCLFRQGVYPYQPFVEAVREYFDIKGVETGEKLEEFIHEKAPELTPLLPVIRLFLNIKDKENIVIESKEQLWDAIFKLIVKISHERALILFIDDLHWADEDTLNLFYYTARNTTRSKVMIIGTYRPEDVQEKVEGKVHPLIDIQHEMSRAGILTVIELDRLTVSEIREMASSLFENADFDESFYDTLYIETEGNPFFVMETLKLFKTEEVIEKENGGYRLREDYDRMTIPSKVHDIVIRRVKRLTDEEREILEIGAVEGEAFHSGTIVNCLEINRMQLLRKLQALEREHHIIHPQEKMYRFDHGKIREILYNTITPELRTEYHLRIGNYLADTYAGDERLVPNIANHLLEGGEDQKALPFLIKAGEHAKIVFANEQAVECYQKALAIIQHVEQSESQLEKAKGKDLVLEGLGDVSGLTGRYEAALENYNLLTGISNLTPTRRVELFRKIGTIHVSRGENEKALTILSRAESELEKHLNSIEQQDENFINVELQKSMGKIRIARARIFKAQGHYDKAKLEIEEGVKLLGDEGNLKEKGQAYNDLGNIFCDQGDYSQATKMYSRSLELREEISDKKGIGETFNNCGIVSFYEGNYEKSAEMLEKSIKIMHEIGFRSGIAGTYNTLGAIYQYQGRYQQSFDIHQKGLDISEETGDIPGIVISCANLGAASLEMKNFRQAREYLEKCLHLMKEMANRVHEPQIRVWLSQALVELGKYKEAKEMALKALEMAKEINQKAMQAFSKRALGVIELKQLKVKKGTSIDKKTCNRIERQLTESLKILEELKMEHEIGRSCLELAHLYHLKRDSGEAQKHIFRAKEIFKKLGAMGDLEKTNNLEIK